MVRSVAPSLIHENRYGKEPDWTRGEKKRRGETTYEAVELVDEGQTDGFVGTEQRWVADDAQTICRAQKRTFSIRVRFLFFQARRLGGEWENWNGRTYVLGRMESHAPSLSGEGGCLNLGSLVKVLVMGPGGSG